MEKGKNLHRLVYWYGYDNSRAFSIISAIQPKILSYEEGVEKHLHKIPPEIQSKVNKKQKVTKKEMLIISNLKAGEEEYALPLRNRSLWLHKFKEEHELESDNEHHDGSQLNESSGCDDENEEDSVHDNSQQDDDYNGKGPLQDDQLLSSDSSFRDDVWSDEEEEKDDDDEQDERDEQQKHNFTDDAMLSDYDEHENKENFTICKKGGQQAASHSTIYHLSSSANFHKDKSHNRSRKKNAVGNSSSSRSTNIVKDNYNNAKMNRIETSDDPVVDLRVLLVPLNSTNSDSTHKRSSDGKKTYKLQIHQGDQVISEKEIQIDEDECQVTKQMQIEKNITLNFIQHRQL